MTVNERETEHSFTAYNESLVLNKNDERTKFVRDFEHIIAGGKEFVNFDGNFVPFPRKNFPFDIHDIEFTKNVENETLFLNGDERIFKNVQHIQVKNIEYIHINGEYQQYSLFNPLNSTGAAESSANNKLNPKLWGSKKIIAAVAVMILLISAAAAFSAFAFVSPSQEDYPDVESRYYTTTTAPEPTPGPTIPGYFEKKYSWMYNDRADRMIWTDANGERSYSMTISVSKNSYYRSQQADHSSRLFSTYVNDTMNQEATKQIADKLLELGKKYGFGDFENAMNAATFVQECIPYTEDEVTTGYREYFRYPVETLIDDGGDCEDSSILLASILQNMGYEVIVIGLQGNEDLQGHAAVAIKDVVNPVCGNCAQIEYDGDKYMYIESTNSAEIGQIPYEYYGGTAYDYN